MQFLVKKYFFSAEIFQFFGIKALDPGTAYPHSAVTYKASLRIRIPQRCF
jgi:hypothetical protein